MEWNLFIIPLTMILTQIIKGFEVDTRWLPVAAVVIGGALGALFGSYYQVDYLEHIVSGMVYGASAAGLYDVGEAATRVV